nr:MAG TPA: protein of unknown function (DUF4083) [Caudoviricetes sp.]
MAECYIHEVNERSKLLITKQEAHKLNSKLVIFIVLIILSCMAILFSVISIIRTNKQRQYNKDLNSVIAEANEQLEEAKAKRDEIAKQLEEERQKNNDLTSKVDELNKQLAERQKQKNILSLTKVSSFKSYMDYRTITNKGSYAYQLQKQAITDENGLRKINDYYCVAMGTRYGKVGDKLYIETDEGAHWNVILADIKSDKHTDSTHSYTLSNGCMMEFIVDTRKMPTHIKHSGTVNGLGFQGKITVVKHI